MLILWDKGRVAIHNENVNVTVLFRQAVEREKIDLFFLLLIFSWRLCPTEKSSFRTQRGWSADPEVHCYSLEYLWQFYIKVIWWRQNSILIISWECWLHVDSISWAQRRTISCCSVPLHVESAGVPPATCTLVQHSSGQEEPCSCINNWTEISSKVFFNLYGNELKSKSLKWILVHF